MAGWLERLFRPAKQVTPTHVEDLDDLQRLLHESDGPVLLDVWSEGCAPCRALAPVLVDIATRYEGRVRVAEANTGADARLLDELDVHATPTVIVFANGREFGRVVGFRPAGWFEPMIEKEFPTPA